MEKIIQEFRKNGKELRVVGYDDNGDPIEKMRTMMTVGVDEEGNLIKQDITNVKTQKLVGDQMHKSAAYVGQIDKIENKGSDALKEALMQEKVNISVGSKIAGLKKEEQEHFIEQALAKRERKKVLQTMTLDGINMKKQKPR